MNILELFAGSRSIGKEAEKLSMRVFSTDVEPFANIDLVKDIRNFKYSDVPFIPNIIWASPPCTSFSILSCRFHWEKEGEVFTPKTETGITGLVLVQKTLSIIQHYLKLNPKLVWYIENPRGLLRKMPLMQNLLRHTVTYCQYGDTRMKPTDIWTNNIAWKPKEVCKNGSPCHLSCPRGSHAGTVSLPNSYERSKVPPHLCKEVLIAARKRILDTN